MAPKALCKHRIYTNGIYKWPELLHPLLAHPPTSSLTLYVPHTPEARAGGLWLNENLRLFGPRAFRIRTLLSSVVGCKCPRARTAAAAPAIQRATPPGGLSRAFWRTRFGQLGETAAASTSCRAWDSGGAPPTPGCFRPGLGFSGLREQSSWRWQ